MLSLCVSTDCSLAEQNFAYFHVFQIYALHMHMRPHCNDTDLEGRGGGGGGYLSSVPGNFLLILRPVVVQVCDSIQPHDIDPVGHEVQVEHSQRP